MDSSAQPNGDDNTTQTPPGSITSPVPHQASASVSVAGGMNEMNPSTSSNDHSIVPLIICSMLTDDTRPRVHEQSIWTEYQIGENDWVILKNSLATIYRTPRFDYFSQTHTFAYQILSDAHEHYLFGLSIALRNKLFRLGSSRREHAFMHNMLFYNRGGAKPLDSNSGMHQMDGFLRNDDLPSYGVGVEIAFSQKRARLQELAEFHLLQSEQSVQWLLVIDFDHPRSKKVSLLTWKLCNCDVSGARELEVHDQVIRDENGALIPGDPLEISLLDIAPYHIVPPSLREKTIELSVEEIFKIVDGKES
ncbi:uncharacterized protein Z520_11728 [Fonsecaea multimorphosa CBS 102226]|uniref:Uncharacterized protein n=1 Tax=Fonsecaea multimorphosa CBS 102226 TaxID=1442371 RepID=A0A0D2JHA0_9EURO|nr:uncharacterized protein Z520_11728 [Fonsecaea multimorphosa CBS 102226]KIX92552.1 hypothetical protein Z520_11728 [Fonsecaea multimorphosa CBS 102226]OAL17819.1 hypothetical protein AYO22_11246 [Fonsecaea multimorphosa]